MPYPILTLPYPFAKRLPQLLSPSELQSLQIAAGHFEGPLKPVVLTHKALYTTFDGDTSDVIVLVKQKWSELAVKIRDEKVVYNCGAALFDSLSNAVFENNHFNNIHFVTRDVYLDKCEIDAKFLKKLARKFELSQVKRLYLEEENSIIYPSTRLSNIFKIFPFLNTLHIFSICSNWLNDLVTANITTEIRKLLIGHNNFEELVSFNSDDFHCLLEKHPRIVLNLVYYATNELSDDDRNYFDTRLKVAFGLRKHTNYENVSVTFDVLDANADIKWTWFVNDLRND